MIDAMCHTHDGITLQLRHRQLNNFWRNSPYYLKSAADQGRDMQPFLCCWLCWSTTCLLICDQHAGSGGVASEIEQLSGPSKRQKQESTLQLNQIMEVHPKYFPAELYGEKQRRLLPVQSHAFGVPTPLCDPDFMCDCAGQVEPP